LNDLNIYNLYIDCQYIYIHTYIRLTICILNLTFRKYLTNTNILYLPVCNQKKKKQTNLNH